MKDDMKDTLYKKIIKWFENHIFFSIIILIIVLIIGFSKLLESIDNSNSIIQKWRKSSVKNDLSQQDSTKTTFIHEDSTITPNLQLKRQKNSQENIKNSDDTIEIITSRIIFPQDMINSNVKIEPPPIQVLEKGITSVSVKILKSTEYEIEISKGTKKKVASILGNTYVSSTKFE